MSDTNTETKPAGKAPSHVAYHVRDRGEGQKSFWTRIGSAWAHADGKGFNIQHSTVQTVINESCDHTGTAIRGGIHHPPRLQS